MSNTENKQSAKVEITEESSAAPRAVDSEVEPISVTIPGAKKATGLGTTTLYSLINDGKLESFCIGRRRLITWASLKRLANHGGQDAR